MDFARSLALTTPEILISVSGLVLLLIAIFPFMALAFWWISRHVHEASRGALDAFGRLNDQVQESLSGVRTLRALGPWSIMMSRRKSSIAG